MSFISPVIPANSSSRSKSSCVSVNSCLFLFNACCFCLISCFRCSLCMSSSTAIPFIVKSFIVRVCVRFADCCSIPRDFFHSSIFICMSCICFSYSAFCLAASSSSCFILKSDAALSFLRCSSICFIASLCCNSFFFSSFLAFCASSINLIRSS